MKLALVTALAFSTHVRADDRAVAHDLEAGRFDQIQQQYSAGLAADAGVHGLQRLMSSNAQRGGRLQKCDVTRPNHIRCNYERGPDLDIDLAFSGATITAARFNLVARDMPPTKTRLRLPLDGELFAMNANREAGNRHNANPNQRHAVDWSMRDAANKSFRGDGSRVTDYYCYGKPVVAVAAGTVVLVVDGAPDVPIGQVDSYNGSGNHLAIAIGPGEFAYYSHLRAGSFRVRVGDVVKAGQEVAAVGNSGNTTEPHLHFQLSTQPMLYAADSIPAVYAEILVDGVRVVNALPQTGQRVAAVPEMRQDRQRTESK